MALPHVCKTNVTPKRAPKCLLSAPMVNRVFAAALSNKPYITAGVIGTLGVLQGLDILILPESAWLVLGALGLGFLRAGVNKVGKVVKETK